MRRFLRENSLSVAAFTIFILIYVGQSLVGQRAFNDDQQAHHEPTVSYGTYIRSAHFGEATFENWESEFLQMGGYVLLTVWLKQKGSPESKPLEGDDPVDDDPAAHRHDPEAPWPVRRGGVVSTLYSHSLSIAFLSLFAAAFLLHAWTGAHAATAEALAHGQPPVRFGQYLTTAQMWFESLQNWQSEFMAVGAIVVLSIWLRERGSTESKPVHAPHAKTGSE
jgi:hypothetical protein